MKKLLFVLLLVFSISQLPAHDRLPWLKTEGGGIIDSKGSTFVFRGINLGGWLAEEMWMLPFKKNPGKKEVVEIKDYVTLWSTVERRFGKAGMERIRKTMRNEWLAEADFAKIALSGFNCVRLPFYYDIMEEPTGLFLWLDRAIELASKYNIYVILDMHGTPGRQSSEQHTGAENCCRLFFDSTCVQKTCEIWAKIAERYKNRSVVAGYDLINEPMGAPNNVILYLVQDQIYRAIRAHDTKHIIFIEDGFKGLDHMPNPAVAGWKNVVYSTHTYPSVEGSEKEMQQLIEKIVALRTAFKTPIYLGEFNVKSNDKAKVLQQFIAQLQAHEISWSLWTYKLVGDKGKDSMWGLYNRPKKLKKIDLVEDSMETVLKKLQQLRTENLKENKDLLAALRFN